MKQDEDPALLRVAEAISDGTPVDWDTARPALRGKVEHLRLIEEVARAHRTPAPAPRPAGARTVPDRAADLLTTSVTPPTGPAMETSAQAVGEVSLSAWGPLKILERLDGGGFGDVFRAFDPGLQREVALKLPRVGRGSDDVDAGRFLKEGRRLARVRHPNVLVVHGADEHEGRVGIWTDLLRGKTLEQLLAEQGPFGAHEAALVGIDLCHALAAVHAAGLIHRDVKTRNVMREQGGRIVLMDFGSVSERPRAGGGQSGNEDPGSGTPLFMAPEHLLTDQPATPASDIYGLGVILYRLVSGRFPVEADTMDALIEKHRAGTSVSLRDARSDLPTAFVQTVERALDPDPRRRFQSAGALERALAVAAGMAGASDSPAFDQIAGARHRSSLRCWLMRAAWVGGGRRGGSRPAAPAPDHERTLHRRRGALPPQARRGRTIGARRPGRSRRSSVPRSPEPAGDLHVRPERRQEGRGVRPLPGRA
jgi:serine/threonine-protein kinase